MKFVMSFSCGKDSIYALDRMLSEGHTPVALIVACNKNSGRSFFHGADEALLDAYADALGIPCIKTYADGEDYSEKFEEGLKKAKEMGAEAACFGDICLLSSKKWNAGRATAAGLEAVLPLWKKDNVQHVKDVIDAGYKCLIKIVDTDALSEEFLGKYLDEQVMKALEENEVDVCGENGEYHTIVTDGPIFKHPLDIQIGSIGKSGSCAYLETEIIK